MALKRIGPLAASQNVEIGDTGDSTVGSFMLHVSGTWTGSITPKAYLRGNGLAAADKQPIYYRNMKTGALVDPTVTAITANGIYEIIADALSVVLDVVVATGTGPVIDAIPLRG